MCHGDMTNILILATLIPPSTTKVKQSFSLMKLICTRLQRLLTSEHLFTCMRISRFQELMNEDFQEILKQWLQAEDTKSKQWRVASHLPYMDTQIYVIRT